MVKALKHDLMEQDMKDNGKATELMALENFYMLMEMFMKENEEKIKQMAKEYIGKKMERVMKENEKMIYSMDMAKKFGLMEVDMKDIIN